MRTYISILRGINVGGHRSVKMDALRQLCCDMGFAQVQTYIQSGNVLFQAESMDPSALERRIAAKFGFEVPVIVMELEELSEIVRSNPFLKDPSKDPSFMHVTFLSGRPDKAALDKIKGGKYEEDELASFDKAIYLYCPNKYSNSRLTNGFFESKLKVTATTRNWKTTTELLAMAQKISRNVQGG
jgi:uncharacterized protein (DUF1697 family)